VGGTWKEKNVFHPSRVPLEEFRRTR